MRCLLEWHPGTRKGLRQRSRLGRGAIEHGEVRERVAALGNAVGPCTVHGEEGRAADHALERRDDGLRLGGLGWRHLDRDALVHVAYHLGNGTLLPRGDYLR